jgi:hypothetical protein
MSNEKELARECLTLINPASLSYEEWAMVGMALKHAGGTAEEYDSWSRRDSRYKEGEPMRKWQSFKRGEGVTVGTLVKFARDQGQEPSSFGEYIAHEGPDQELAWDATIGGKQEKKDELRIVRQEWIQDTPLPVAEKDWDGKADFIKYLRTVFQPEEHVGIVTDAYESEPNTGSEQYL